jgi:N-acetylglucosamine-6-sulfatase
VPKYRMEISPLKVQLKTIYAVVAALVAATLVLTLVVGGQREASSQVAQPNFVFFFTDDMRKDDLLYMPKTRSLIGAKGMEFENEYVPLASCCPSRASVLRGQYVHNHGVWLSDVTVPTGGYPAWKPLESDNLATRLQAAGYRTGLFGKYMNGYTETTGKPPGWNDFFGKNGGSGYFTYSVNDNGVDKNYGTAETDYFMDVISRESRTFVQQSVNQGKPFFAHVSPNVPHEPSIPAPRHINTHNGVNPPDLPSYDEANVSDKPPWIQSLPRINASERAAIQQQHEDRVESLQSVDEAVSALVKKLNNTGQLANTYIIFTSDNGWQHGEHRIVERHKEQVYEESSKMPFLVRGPGITPASSTAKLTSHIDVMPTLLDYAGASIPGYVDGRSLRPVLEEDTATTWRTALLLESRDRRDSMQDYFAIRTAGGAKYVEYASGFKEFYDLHADPYEMNSRPSMASAGLVDRLQRLKSCAGDSCRAIENE